MKKLTIYIILILPLIISILYLLKLKKETDERLKIVKIEVAQIKKQNLKLLDNKIAEFQFSSNNYYRKNEYLKPFFDSLDTSYRILRKYIGEDEEEVSIENQIFLNQFLLYNLPKIGGMTEEDVLKRMKIKSRSQIFKGTKFEITKRLVEGLNLNFMTGGRYSYNYYDIWREETELEIEEGETTKVMIRLLRNYEFRSNHLELVPSEKMRIIEPYLGEITIHVPNNLNDKKVHEIEFELFDWINRDTITERILIPLRKN